MVVDGKYVVVLDATWGRQKAELELRTHGSELSGTLIGAMDLKFGNGVVSGNNLSWTMEGQIAKIYPEIVRWKCTATLDGDKITGYATVSGDIGDAPFHGTRAGKGGEAEVALPWTDLGLPRYEAISVEWVKAMGAYMKKKAENHRVEFDLTWSIEYTNPPAHLLRGHGPDIVGYHMIFKNGTVEVFDGPLPNPDVHFVYPYDPFALRLRMGTDDYIAWVKEEGAPYASQVKTSGDLPKMKLLVAHGPGNDIREEFLSQQTV